MFVRDSETHSLIPFKSPPTAYVPPNQKVLVREPWPAALLTDLPAPPEDFPQPAISYIVRGYPQRGHFDPKKAIALGVPRGPLYKQLASGVSLTLENGKIVSPEMVLGPTKPGGGVAIIDFAPSRYGRTPAEPTEGSQKRLCRGRGDVLDTGTRHRYPSTGSIFHEVLSKGATYHIFGGLMPLTTWQWTQVRHPQSVYHAFREIIFLSLYTITGRSPKDLRRV